MNIVVRALTMVALGVCLPGLSGCSPESKAEDAISQSSSSSGAGFEVLHYGQFTVSGMMTRKQIKVLTSQTEFAAELANYSAAVAKVVDFTKGKVLLVDMGPRPSAGYGIAVTSLTEEVNAVVANVDLSASGANCVQAQVITNPYQFVYIPTRKEILVSEKITLSNC